MRGVEPGTHFCLVAGCFSPSGGSPCACGFAESSGRLAGVSRRLGAANPQFVLEFGLADDAHRRRRRIRALSKCPPKLPSQDVGGQKRVGSGHRPPTPTTLGVLLYEELRSHTAPRASSLVAPPLPA